jgi:phage gp36-like protein
MPAWVVITSSDLDDYSVGSKVNALRTAALSGGQGDPFDRVMPDVAATCRNMIASNAGNVLSATANSVPPETKTHVCWLIIEALQTRLMGLKLTEEERRMIDRAWQYFRDVAKGDVTVSAPDDPSESEVQGGAAISVVSTGERVSNRDTLAGL